MRKKLITMSLSLLFLGSIAGTSLATTLQYGKQTTVVDDDKDKNKKKTKTSQNKTKECKSEKSCCKSELYEKSCKSDSKNGGDKK
jgi:hypothetical protein